MGACCEKEKETSPCCSCCASSGAEEGEHANERTIAPWLILAGVSTVVGSLLHILLAFDLLPLSPSILQASMIVSSAISLTGVAAGLVIVVPEALESLRRRSIDINILMVIAVAGACLLADFSEAAAVVFFFCVGESLEQRAMRRNRESIADLMTLTPELVHVQAADGTIADISPDEVSLGTAIVVRPGERIPLDGQVLSGSAAVDEAPITGESVPVLKQVGDTVFAGTLATDGKLVYANTATVENSTLARIIKLVEQSQSQRTPYERFINRFARYYTPLIVVIAALVALVPTLLTLLTPLELGGIATWGYRALTLLVIACPCALVIATPVCVVTGLSRAARNGVLVKGGAFLEQAAKVRAVAFDKTGTLTFGRPAVSELRVFSAAARRWGDDAHQQVLAIAAVLEQDSTHPLAQAIIRKAQGSAGEEGKGGGADLATNAPAKSVTTTNTLATNASSPLAVTKLRELAGRGIAAELDGIPAAIGSSTHIAELVDYDNAARAHIEQIEQDAASALVVAYDGQAIGVIGVKDLVRPESAAVLARLAKQGIHTVMLTGDNLATARAIAGQAGIEQVHAGLLPGDKMDKIEQLRKQYGTVAMVGDGINDAPALAQADIGIAMGAAGSDTALEVADVALMADNISELPGLFVLGRRIVSTIHTNIAFALIIKAAVMVLAIIGLAQMWMAIFADVGVLLIVIAYSMRIGLTRTSVHKPTINQ